MFIEFFSAIAAAQSPKMNSKHAIYDIYETVLTAQTTECSLGHENTESVSICQVPPKDSAQN